jgi:long-chain acyl-CoA synthetase
MTLQELVRESAAEHGDKIFMFFGNREISYRELNQAANRVAAGLVRLGIKKGSKVALLVTNRPEFVFSMFGAYKLGAVTVPINCNLKAEEIEYIISNSDASTIITSPEFTETVRGVQSRVAALKTFVVLGDDLYGGIPFDALMTEKPDEPAVDVLPEDEASIIYTSGTTGKPKGVILTHDNYCFDARSMVEGANITESDRYMCVLPLFHVNGQVVTVIGPMVAGASMVLCEGFSPSTFFADLERFQATTFSAVPTIYSILLNLPDASAYDLSRLSMCICGAAPMPVEVFTEFEKRFSAFIIEGYGLSEGTCASCVNPVGGLRKIGSIGLPLPGQEMKIVDSDGRPLGTGEVGEIVTRGRHVMKGYYKNPQATAEVLKDGWLYTGDLGYSDEDGYFFISGRKKEMIIRGGANIYPKEVEEILYQHPAVKEAAVIGVPDKIWGEEVVACVILKDEAQATEEVLIAFAKQKLADYKCPKQVFFMTEMPKTATGKIQKGVLAERVAPLL